MTMHGQQFDAQVASGLSQHTSPQASCHPCSRPQSCEQVGVEQLAGLFTGNTCHRISLKEPQLVHGKSQEAEQHLAEYQRRSGQAG